MGYYGDITNKKILKSRECTTVREFLNDFFCGVFTKLPQPDCSTINLYRQTIRDFIAFGGITDGDNVIGDIFKARLELIFSSGDVPYPFAYKKEVLEQGGLSGHNWAMGSIENLYMNLPALEQGGLPDYLFTPQEGYENRYYETKTRNTLLSEKDLKKIIQTGFTQVISKRDMPLELKAMYCSGFCQFISQFGWNTNEDYDIEAVRKTIDLMIENANFPLIREGLALIGGIPVEGKKHPIFNI